ncbi:hypothetical protein MC885_012845 [Smutsia gigantea]|nr:hypothetical protein MC885_012845 [Smutsia gigantea]
MGFSPEQQPEPWFALDCTLAGTGARRWERRPGSNFGLGSTLGRLPARRSSASVSHYTECHKGPATSFPQYGQVIWVCFCTTVSKFTSHLCQSRN